MEWVIWGFAGLAAGVAGIIGIAAWIVFRRDRHLPNQGVTLGKARTVARSNPSRGVPSSK